MWSRHSRRADGRAQRPDSARGRHLIALRPVLGVVVTDQEAWALPERGGLAELPGHPVVHVGVACHPNMDDAPTAERDNEIREQRTGAQVGDREEVAGPDLVGVVAPECRPGLSAGAWGTGVGK